MLVHGFIISVAPFSGIRGEKEFGFNSREAVHLTTAASCLWSYGDTAKMKGLSDHFISKVSF